MKQYKFYMIIDGRTGDIIRYTNNKADYPNVFETLVGGLEDYWTHVQLPEKAEVYDETIS